MPKTFRPWDVDQGWLPPPSAHELVPPGHLAHFIRDTVREALDLSAILADYDGERGYPPYHPGMMVALPLYAYCRGVYSSRQIARACEERVDSMAVTGLQRPDFRTVAGFRRRHLAALADLSGQVLKLCRAAGLVRLGHVAIGGTKLGANASRHKAMSYGRMAQAEAHRPRPRWPRRCRVGWARLTWPTPRRTPAMAPTGAATRCRTGWPTRRAALRASGRRRRRWRPRRPRRPRPMRTTVPAHRRACNGEDDRCARKAAARRIGRSATPPIPPAVSSRRGTASCRAATPRPRWTHAQSQVIAAQRLVAGPADYPGLVPLVDQVRDHLRRHPREVSADAGFCTEGDLTAMAERRIAAYVPPGRARHGEASAAGRRRLKAKPLAIALADKLRRAGRRSRYRLRKQTAEPVFGQMKHASGFRQFLLRGLDRARGEWALLRTAHNLLKPAKAAAA